MPGDGVVNIRPRSPRQCAPQDRSASAISLLIACVLFLMVVLSHPYIGEIATSPEPLREVVAFLSPSSS
jgi:hypothetical protein